MRFILITWRGYGPDQQEAKSGTYHLRYVEKAEDISGNSGQRVYNLLWGSMHRGRTIGDILSLTCGCDMREGTSSQLFGLMPNSMFNRHEFKDVISHDGSVRCIRIVLSEQHVMDRGV